MKQLKLNNSATISYKIIEGNRDNPCLVFLHEGLGCIEMWKHFPEHLCQRIDCPGIVYDRQGYGNSSPITRERTIHYLHDYALNELPEIISRLIPKQPFFIIGHSDGGSIGLIYASERPSYLKGVITEAAHVFVEAETLEGVMFAKGKFEGQKFDNLWNYHKDKTETIFYAWSNTWSSDWFSHWNIEYLLPSILCPILVIQGSMDPYGTEKQVESIVSKTGGHSEKSMINECGHIPHNEQREVILARMHSFIKSQMKIMYG